MGNDSATSIVRLCGISLKIFWQNVVRNYNFLVEDSIQASYAVRREMQDLLLELYLCLTCLLRDSKSGRGLRSFPSSTMLEFTELKVAESINIWPPRGTSLIALLS